MRSVKKMIENILRKDKIHINSGVFEDALLCAIGISEEVLNGKKAKDVITFHWDNIPKEDQEYWKNFPNLKLTFNLNTNIDTLITQLLMQHLGLNLYFYRIHIPMPVNNKRLQEVILPQFQEWFKKLSKQQLDAYRTNSLPFLEKDAVNKIERISSVLLKKINKQRRLNGELQSFESSLKDMLIALENIKHLISIDDYFYEQNKRLMNQLENIMSLPEVKERYGNTKILLANMKKYDLFNRQESIILKRKVINQLELFLKKYKISATQCNVFIDTIYSCAGIEKKQTFFKFDQSYEESSRIKVILHDMTPSDIEKLTQYFYSLDHSSITTIENTNNSSEELSSSKEDNLKRKIYITFDAKAFKENILPIFKKEFIKNTKNLVLYQEQSVSYFFEKAKMKSRQKKLVEKKVSLTSCQATTFNEIEKDNKIKKMSDSNDPDAFISSLIETTNMSKLN